VKTIQVFVRDILTKARSRQDLGGHHYVYERMSFSRG
jgi:hypothetical protein